MPIRPPAPSRFGQIFEGTCQVIGGIGLTILSAVATAGGHPAGLLGVIAGPGIAGRGIRNIIGSPEEETVLEFFLVEQGINPRDARQVENALPFVIGIPRGNAGCRVPPTGNRTPFTMMASPAESGFGIYGDLNAQGMIEFYIAAGPQATPRGHVLFKAMIDHFGSQAQGVIGSWTYGTNLAAFNQLTAQGMSLEQAAAATWTGIQATQNGFRSVRVVSTVGSPGAYTQVLVEFTY